MRQYPNQSIIDAFTKADRGAFRQVLDFYYPAIYYFCQGMIRNSDAAVDIAVGTFRKLFKRCVHFNADPDIKAFLYITARNTCLDYLRLTTSMKPDDGTLASAMQNNILLELEYGIKYELTENITAAVDDLPEECQNIFRMLYYQDLTPAEVADILEIPINAVYEQKRRAFLALGIPLND